MITYVLDTHAFVLTLTAPKKLGRDAARAMRRVEAGQDQAWLPAVAAAEVALLHQLGRTGIGIAEMKAALADAPGIRLLPLDLPQLETFATLTSVRDPFDRLIVSAALATSSRLLTKDVALAESGLVQVVW
jgi:PIN domain nuclease of toxin-antitoxin system